jgi:hypothetical protein
VLAAVALWQKHDTDLGDGRTSDRWTRRPQSAGRLAVGVGRRKGGRQSGDVVGYGVQLTAGFHTANIPDGFAL